MQSKKQQQQQHAMDGKLHLQATGEIGKVINTTG